ncbi:EbsA family protein [Eupransor demetentiae]|uniref:Pore-forming protein n=1 Tax=Eupransor demetentiae TaxID=3109584 RepID=A0ABM9N4I1_9LACO|nr:hypothetical protein R54876_GBNLAHCA_00624 [Lactobacillaceae bacterium LMG 33000]
MRPQRGFYQPIDPWGQIIWMWWLVFLLLGIIACSETFYQLNFWIIAYLIVILAIGCLAFFRRRIFLTGKQLFIGHVVNFDYDEFTLDDGIEWHLAKNRLYIQKQARQRVYWLSPKMVKAIKELQNDGK